MDKTNDLKFRVSEFDRPPFLRVQRVAAKRLLPQHLGWPLDVSLGPNESNEGLLLVELVTKIAVLEL